MSQLPETQRVCDVDVESSSECEEAAEASPEPTRPAVAMRRAHQRQLCGRMENVLSSAAELVDLISAQFENIHEVIDVDAVNESDDSSDPIDAAVAEGCDNSLDLMGRLADDIRELRRANEQRKTRKRARKSDPALRELMGLVRESKRLGVQPEDRKLARSANP